MKDWIAAQTNDDIAQILVFSCLWRTTIGNGVHAVVIFIFNSMVREEVKMLLGIRGQQNTAFVSTVTKTRTQTMMKRRTTIA
uniref:Uncharacterized protein n=1 Tax=Acrobeloides nanus TaxID=290746 RepID=A0A914DZ65_9BILA